MSFDNYQMVDVASSEGFFDSSGITSASTDRPTLSQKIEEVRNQVKFLTELLVDVIDYKTNSVSALPDEESTLVQLTSWAMTLRHIIETQSPSSTTNDV